MSAADSSQWPVRLIGLTLGALLVTSTPLVFYGTLTALAVLYLVDELVREP